MASARVVDDKPKKAKEPASKKHSGIVQIGAKRGPQASLGNFFNCSDKVLKTNTNSNQPLPAEIDDQNSDQNQSEHSEGPVPNLYLKYKKKANDPPKISKASQPPQFGQAELRDFPDGKASIWNFNVNGLNAILSKKGEFQGFVEKAKPDILCLNESKTDLEKITQKGFYKIIPDGYEQHWNCSKTRLGYSGVTIFTRIKPI